MRFLRGAEPALRYGSAPRSGETTSEFGRSVEGYLLTVVGSHLEEVSALTLTACPLVQSGGVVLLCHSWC